MKKKNLDLKKKLVLSKETIANLTPDQQAKVAGGYNQFSANGHCQPPESRPSDCHCQFTVAASDCGGAVFTNNCQTL